MFYAKVFTIFEYPWFERSCYGHLGPQPPDIFGGKMIVTCCCTLHLNMFLKILGMISQLPLFGF